SKRGIVTAKSIDSEKVFPVSSLMPPWKRQICTINTNLLESARACSCIMLMALLPPSWPPSQWAGRTIPHRDSSQMLPTGNSNQQQFVSRDENRHFRTDHLKADLGRRSARGGAVALSAQVLKFVISTAA